MQVVINIHMNRFIVYVLIVSLAACTEDPKLDPIAIDFIKDLPESMDHNRLFQLSVKANHSEGKSLTYSVQVPSWITFNEESLIISGTPGWNRLNSSATIKISATDGEITETLSGSIEVGLGEIICNSDFGDPTESPYRLPYEVGRSFTVNQTYCPSNPNWGHYNWFAYDFEMPMNTPLLAIRSGEVIATKESNPDGTRECGVGRENFVFIKHSDGTVANYVHLIQDGVEVEVGDKVDQGQLIGYSGDSGCSSGPHLHLALFRKRGNYNRQYTIPFNFNNAEGELDRNKGLMQDGRYKALD